MDMRPSGLAEKQSLERPRAAASFATEFMFRWKQKTPYSQPWDRVFPSFMLKGQQPRVANMLVEDYPRPAAVMVGILSSHRDDEGRLLMMIHGDLVSKICVTAWHRFWCALELTQKLYRLCFATVMLN